MKHSQSMRECHRSRARGDIIRIRIRFENPSSSSSSHVVRRRRDGFSKTSSSNKSRAKPQSPNLSRSTALVVGFPRRRTTIATRGRPGDSNASNVKRTFSSFSTASAYRRWRGACASCHERYLRVGKEIWGQRRRSRWMRSVSFATGVAREHGRFFTNTRGIIFFKSSSRIASPSSSSSIRTHGSRASSKGGSFAAVREEERESPGEMRWCPNVRETYTLGHIQLSFHFFGFLFVL